MTNSREQKTNSGHVSSIRFLKYRRLKQPKKVAVCLAVLKGNHYLWTVAIALLAFLCANRFWLIQQVVFL